MRKTFLKIFVMASLPFMTAGVAFATDETSSAASESAAPAVQVAPAPGRPPSSPPGEPHALPSIEPPLPHDGVTVSPHSLPGTEDVTHGTIQAAGQGGHDAADGHAATSGLPQMDPTWFPSQIFWLAVTFVCLYVVFSRKILPDLSRTIDNRRNQIQGDLDSAQKLKEEADAVQRAYEAELNEARQKCTQMFQEAEEAIKKKTAKKMDGFTLRAEKETRETEEAIEAAKKDAIGEMNTIAAEIASLAAQKIIGLEPDIDQAKTVIKKLGLKAA